MAKAMVQNVYSNWQVSVDALREIEKGNGAEVAESAFHQGKELAEAALAAARGNREKWEAAAEHKENAVLALCWHTFTYRITTERRRECLKALQEVKADKVFYGGYDGERKKVLAALAEEVESGE